MLIGLKMMRKWWKTWGTAPVFCWVKAASLYKQGKFDQARPYYEKGLNKYKKHPARFCARMDLAYCLFRTQRLEEAEEHLRYVVDKVPHSKEANMRLAQLYLWTGNYLKAAWSLKEAVKHLPSDSEVVAAFLMAVLENGGPSILFKEAINALLKLESHQMSNPKLEVARASLAIHRGDAEKGRAVLAGVAGQTNAPFEAYVAFAKVLLKEARASEARMYLKTAMSMAPNHPLVLSLLAESYLQPGSSYNPEYACQLAIRACQSSTWLSPYDMHILAQAYYHKGDKMSALIVASKAKQVGTEKIGDFRDSATIDELIATLSTGTLA